MPNHDRYGRDSTVSPIGMGTRGRLAISADRLFTMERKYALVTRHTLARSPARRTSTHRGNQRYRLDWSASGSWR